MGWVKCVKQSTNVWMWIFELKATHISIDIVSDSYAVAVKRLCPNHWSKSVSFQQLQSLIKDTDGGTNLLQLDRKQTMKKTKLRE